MGDAARRKAAINALLGQLAPLLRDHPGALRQLFTGLAERGVRFGDEAPSPPPEDCPGCRSAREYGAAQGLPSELGDLILGHLHAMRHGMRPLPLEMLPALALDKGLALTQEGPWRVLLQHLDGCYLLSLQMTAPRSTVADWDQLGKIAARLGAPREPLVPIEKLPPDHAIIWCWLVLGTGNDDAN